MPDKLDEKLKKVIDDLTTSELLKVVSYCQTVMQERSNPSEGDQLDDDSASFRRQYRRHNCNLQATFIRHKVSTNDHQNSTRVNEAVVVDLSQGGLMMKTQDQLDQGEVLTIFLKSEDGTTKKLFVEVRRCVDHWTHFAVGGMFVEQKVVDAAERERLAGNKK